LATIREHLSKSKEFVGDDRARAGIVREGEWNKLDGQWRKEIPETDKFGRRS